MKLKWVPVRFVIVACLTLVTFISQINRSNLAITIVSMTKGSPDHEKEIDICPNLRSNESYDFPMSLPNNATTDETFNWSPEVQGSVLGSFFWVYFMCQPFSGYAADRFGGSIPIAVAMLGTGIVTIASPAATRVSVNLLILLRVLNGICQAGMYPGLFVLICKWMPVHERSVALAVTGVGSVMAEIVLQYATGYLIEAYTWTSMFYVPGGLSIIAFFITSSLLRNSPETHTLITNEELEYIRLHRNEEAPILDGGEDNNNDINSDPAEEKNLEKKSKIPWLQMLMNRSVLVLILFRFAWGISLHVGNFTPTYMANVLHISITDIGIISSIGNVFYMCGSLPSSYASEYIIQKNWLSRTNCRKLMSIFAGTVNAVFAGLLVTVGCNRTAAIAVMYAAAVFQAFSNATDGPMPAEMTSKYPGILYSICNAASVMPGFIAPQYAGAVLGKVPDPWIKWGIVYYSASGFLVFADVIFLLFAEAKVQPFDSR